MPERPFIIIPSSWVYDRGLSACSDFAQNMMRLIFQHSDEYGRYCDDPAVIKGVCFALRPTVRLNQVSAALRELCRAGALLRKNSLDGRSWIEVADHLRYRKGQHRDPRWGAAPEKPPEQPELLPLIGSLSVLPPPQVQPPVRFAPRIPDRERVEQSRFDKTESAHEHAGKTPHAQRPTPNEEESDLGKAQESAGVHSSSYSLSIEELNANPLGRRLGNFLGASQFLREAQASGREWLRILRDEPGELSDILEQAERTRAELPNGSTRAKFITKRLGERRSGGKRPTSNVQRPTSNAERAVAG